MEDLQLFGRPGSRARTRIFAVFGQDGVGFVGFRLGRFRFQRLSVRTVSDSRVFGLGGLVTVSVPAVRFSDSVPSHHVGLGGLVTVSVWAVRFSDSVPSHHDYLLRMIRTIPL